MFMELSMVVLLMIILMLVISMSMDKQESMISPYECGFDPMVMSRVTFSFRFFLVAILFLIFDVEISLLLPIPLVEMNESGLVGVFLFLWILMVGLIHEYYNGALNWVK